MSRFASKLLSLVMSPKNEMAFPSFYALLCARTVVYDHIWGFSANYRIRAINIEFSLADNPCFVTGKNGLKWKICQKNYF